MTNVNKFVLSCALSVFAVQPSDAWNFASYPDPHGNDNAAITGDCNTMYWEQQNIAFAEMTAEKCELLIVPGDQFIGHWWESSWFSKYGSDPEKRIPAIADILFGCFKSNIAKLGFKLVFCPGDHEYGDNPWNAGSEVAKTVPLYKAAFARAFTLDAKGTTLYGGKIGTVDQRPVGTPFENTSYAFIHKNVMIVSLDVFRQDGPNIVLEPRQGTMNSDVTGAHAAWIDAILAAGRAHPAVDYIIVQGHTAIMPPINLTNSSGMFIKDLTNSLLWKSLTKNKVDVYLAGEVHALSCNIDKESKLVQLVHGNNEVVIWHVTDTGLVLDLREKIDRVKFSKTGTMTIKGKGALKTVSTNGNLTPVDLKGLLVYHTFDTTDPVSKNFVSKGQFSLLRFQAIGSNIAKVTGIHNGGVDLSGAKDSYINQYFSEGTLLFNEPRTLSAWFKTTATGDLPILMAGNGADNAFTLKLTNGQFTVKSVGKIVKARSSSLLNDNSWHQVTATWAGGTTAFEDIALYIDGEKAAKEPITSVTRNWLQERVTIAIGTEWTWWTNTVQSTFKGSIDEAQLWMDTLSAPMVKALYASLKGSDLHYGAGQMDSLFRHFRNSTSGMVSGLFWKKSAGLAGAPGSITKDAGNNYHIVLDAAGNGISSGGVPISSSYKKPSGSPLALSGRVCVKGSTLHITSLQKNPLQVSIISLNGTLAFNKTFTASDQILTLNLENQITKSGIYYLKVRCGSGKADENVYTTRLMFLE